MSLEARVQVLEDRQAEWDKVLTGIEATVALTLKEQMETNKRIDALERSTNERFEAIEQRLDAMERSTNERFDKIEETLILIVNRLPM